MAGTNDILTFAQGGAANIMPQTDYAALSARANGFQSGVAQSNQVNKVLRQAAFMARVLSQWAVDQSGGSILDNGDEANAKALLTQAVNALCNAILGTRGYATNQSLTINVNNLVAAISNEATLRAQADALEITIRSAQDTAEAKARNDQIATEANTRYSQDQAIYAWVLSLFGSTTAGGGVWIQSPSCILQTAKVTLSTGNGDNFLFPTQFPNQVWGMMASDWGSGAQICSGVPTSTSGFAAYARNPATGGAYQPGTAFSYLAIGN
jgi:hypothetical protein